MKNILWRCDYEPLLDPINSLFTDTCKFESELEEKMKRIFIYSNEEQKIFFEWKIHKENNLRTQYEKTISDLNKNQDYYYGCSFQIYKRTYSNRLQKFLSNFKESEEEDFLEYELNKGIMHIPYNTDYFSQEQLKKFRFSLEKRFNFLQEQADLLGFDISKEFLGVYWKPQKNQNAEIKDVEQYYTAYQRSLADYDLIPDPARKTKSLKWNDKEYSKISEIYKELEDHGYVNCGLVKFKKIFSCTTEFIPVEWLKEKRSLTYFYGLLIDRNLISKPKPMWAKLSEVFTASDNINPDSAKIEWYRANKEEGNSELFQFLKSLIDRA